MGEKEFRGNCFEDVATKEAHGMGWWEQGLKSWSKMRQPETGSLSQVQHLYTCLIVLPPLSLPHVKPLT